MTSLPNQHPAPVHTGFIPVWGIITKPGDSGANTGLTDSVTSFLPEAIVIVGALILAGLLNAARTEMRLRRMPKRRTR